VQPLDVMTTVGLSKEGVIIASPGPPVVDDVKLSNMINN